MACFQQLAAQTKEVVVVCTLKEAYDELFQLSRIWRNSEELCRVNRWFNEEPC